MRNPFKWHRIGWIEGRIEMDEYTTLKERAVLYVRDPFLWFKTRKVVFIGDDKTIRLGGYKSAQYRKYRIDVDDWLLGGKIDYVSENGTPNPAKIIKLVK